MIKSIRLTVVAAATTNADNTSYGHQPVAHTSLSRRAICSLPLVSPALAMTLDSELLEFDVCTAPAATVCSGAEFVFGLALHHMSRYAHYNNGHSILC